MEQIQVSKQESQVEIPQIVPQVEEFQYLGDLFAEFLETKGRRDEFEELKFKYFATIDGVAIRQVVNGVNKGIAKVADLLLMKVLPSQKERFFPYVAGG